ncbi:MAG: hypothetical protein Q8P03_00025 [bacterium]|nr:hypothetical protein [bacterium]
MQKWLKGRNISLGLVFLFASALVLLDELYREGYLFDFADLFVFRFTHEKIFTLLFLGGLYTQFKNRNGGKS